MKKNKKSTQSESLFNTGAYSKQTHQLTYDPGWDDGTAFPEVRNKVNDINVHDVSPSNDSGRWNSKYFGEEPPRSIDSNGQLSVFFDESYEAPDPDDYRTVEEFESAWDKWQLDELRRQELHNNVNVLNAKQSLEQRIQSESSNVEELDSHELTPSEERDRLLLERTVERAFYEAGKALMELRDRRLYRNSYTTFDEYCKHRFNYNRSRSYQLIDAAAVVDNLKKFPHIVKLPTSERQVRPLTDLEPEEQLSCWEQAVNEAGGKIPSGCLVKGIVQRIMERTKVKVPNPYRKGEVCQIIPKDNPELRGKADCWCFVKDVHEFSCTVVAWDGEYILRVDHLKPLNFLEEGCQTIQRLHKRIASIRMHGDLEETAVCLLKQLGQIRRHYLTEFEETLLNLMENKYTIVSNEQE
ncbi:hypothetical protein CAL7716_056820 [Calothrix sp. PCC 7716]|nr:hypothetical protein CAL7716_056820 [Calothrix sp. PCC 7716]